MATTSRERWQEWEERHGEPQSREVKSQRVMPWAQRRLEGSEKLRDPAKREKFVKRMSEFVVGTAKLQDLIRQGKVKGTLAEHQQAAREAQAKHEAELHDTLKQLQEVAPQGATVMGRVKTEGSMIGKVARKPKYERPDRLQDITGTSIIVDDISGAEKALTGVRGRFKVVGEDDYFSKPQAGGYRARHMVIETPSGLQKEVQIKTRRQLAFQHWSHDVYKPTSAEQARALKQHSGILAKYAQEMSDYLYDRDRGLPATSPPPPCPEETKKVFGCVAVG